MSINPVLLNGEKLYLRSETDIQMLISPRFCHYIYPWGDLKGHRCESVVVKGKRYCQSHTVTEQPKLSPKKEAIRVGDNASTQS